jgi:2-amino-4-hydroxy-6-hydroxymethyldihydropteridine diphosphokinase
MILIGMGANLPTAFGSPRESLVSALDLLPSLGISVVRCSSFYSTPAVAHDVQPAYVNAVAVVNAALSAPELLAALHRLEAEFGRVRRVRWAPRTLDLDLLDYHGQIVASEGPRGADAGSGILPLALPHPGLVGRGFVLVPLAEVAPDWRHPVSGLNAKGLIQRLMAAEGPSALTGIERLPS